MTSCADLDALHRAAAGLPLGSADQAAFDAHLAQCPACVARVKNTVVVTEVLRRLEPQEGDAAESPRVTEVPLREDLVQRILTARRAAGLADEQGGGREQRRSG